MAGPQSARATVVPPEVVPPDLQLQQAPPLPPFLVPLRAQAAALTRQIETTAASAKLAADELEINEKLVRQGYAQVVTFPPNVKYQDLFLRL